LPLCTELVGQRAKKHKSNWRSFILTLKDKTEDMYRLDTELSYLSRQELAKDF